MFCFMDADREYMCRALELAALGRGRTSPNPMVGCVVVREGRVIGEGCHQKAGEPHAEVNAINAA
ncbi:MAG: bifunctional diaminohydroxyphosphoribosylaminopyrimidine deaminase/5-amino-6-(5-phosphoribosylamino)uracil reductase, partial [bacterium]